jgi:hypothetical protein
LEVARVAKGGIVCVLLVHCSTLLPKWRVR